MIVLFWPGAYPSGELALPPRIRPGLALIARTGRRPRRRLREQIERRQVRVLAPGPLLSYCRLVNGPFRPSSLRLRTEVSS